MSSIIDSMTPMMHEEAQLMTVLDLLGKNVVVKGRSMKRARRGIIIAIEFGGAKVRLNSPPYHAIFSLWEEIYT